MHAADPSARPQLLRLAATFAALGAMSGVWASRLPALKAKLGLTEGDVGLALLCAAIGTCVGAFVAGKALRRFGPRALAFLGACTFGPLLVAISLAPSLAVLGAVMAVLGVTLALYDIAINAEAVRAETAFGRAVLSRLHGGYALGLSLGAASGAAAEGAGLDFEFHLWTAAALLTAVFAISAGALSVRASDAHHDRSGGSALSGWTPPLIALTVLAFVAVMSEGVPMDWSALLVAEWRDGGRALGASALTAFGVAMTVARFAGDWVTDRIGRERVVWLGGAVAVAGLLVAGLSPHPAAAVAGFALAGAGVAPLFPSLVALFADRLGAGPEAGAQRVAGIAYVAFLLGPASVGWLSERVGLPTVFAGLALTLAATLLAARAVVGAPPRTG